MDPSPIASRYGGGELASVKVLLKYRVDRLAVRSTDRAWNELRPHHRVWNEDAPTSRLLRHHRLAHPEPSD